MENEVLRALTQVMLSVQILDYFTVVGVEFVEGELHISLEERMSEELLADVHFESKGFMDVVRVADFLPFLESLRYLLIPTDFLLCQCILSVYPLLCKITAAV